MKLKLTGSTFVALIIYLITALIGLIQFNPLAEVLISGVKYAVMGFAFTMIISFALEFMNKPAEETAGESKGKNQQQNQSQNNKQPKGKAGQAYQQNNKSPDNDNTQQNKERQTEDNSEDFEDNEWDFDDDFSEMEPPVIEYEQNK